MLCVPILLRKIATFLIRSHFRKGRNFKAFPKQNNVYKHSSWNKHFSIEPSRSPKNSNRSQTKALFEVAKVKTKQRIKIIVVVKGRETIKKNCCLLFCSLIEAKPLRAPIRHRPWANIFFSLGIELEVFLRRDVITWGRHIRKR